MQRLVHRLALGALVALLAALLLGCTDASATPLGPRAGTPAAGPAAGSVAHAAATLHQDHVPAPRPAFAHQSRTHQAPRLHDAGAAEPVTAVRARLLRSIDTAGARAGAGPPAPYPSSAGSRAPPA